MNEVNFTHLTGSIIALLAAGFWAVLFAAFRETGNAGISRLVEKKTEGKTHAHPLGRPMEPFKNYTAFLSHPF